MVLSASCALFLHVRYMMPQWGRQMEERHQVFQESDQNDDSVDSSQAMTSRSTLRGTSQPCVVVWSVEIIFMD